MGSLEADLWPSSHNLQGANKVLLSKEMIHQGEGINNLAIVVHAGNIQFGSASSMRDFFWGGGLFGLLGAAHFGSHFKMCDRKCGVLHFHLLLPVQKRQITV